MVFQVVTKGKTIILSTKNVFRVNIGQKINLKFLSQNFAKGPLMNKTSKFVTYHQHKFSMQSLFYHFCIDIFTCLILSTNDPFERMLINEFLCRLVIRKSYIYILFFGSSINDHFDHTQQLFKIYTILHPGCMLGVQGVYSSVNRIHQYSP